MAAHIWKGKGRHKKTSIGRIGISNKEVSNRDNNNRISSSNSSNSKLRLEIVQVTRIIEVSTLSAITTTKNSNNSSRISSSRDNSKSRFSHNSKKTFRG